MRRLKRSVFAALAAALLCLGATPGYAGGHGHGGGGWHGGGGGHGGYDHHGSGSRVYVNLGVGPGFYGWGPRAAWWGGPAFYRAYPSTYYGYYAPPAVIYAPPPVIVREAGPIYVERPSVPEVAAEPDDAYWYYCPSRREYYPKVSSCPEAWLKVVPNDR